jgi:hypothetical protein
MMRVFTPIKEDNTLEVPYFEDARADFAPFYRTRINLKELEGQVLGELAKLGAAGFLVAGHFEIDGLTRCGYELRFSYMQGNGVIRVAGLPLRGKETKLKAEDVRKQALANLREWLKTAVTMQIFGDKGASLIPHMLVDGKRTVAEVMLSTGYFPALPSGETIIDGEFVEE